MEHDLKHDLTSTILRASDRVLNGELKEIWVIERWPNYYNAFSVELAQTMVNHDGAKLMLKVSKP